MPAHRVGDPRRGAKDPLGGPAAPSAEEIHLVATHLARAGQARGADADVATLLSTLGLDGGAGGPASRVPLDVWRSVGDKLSRQGSRPNPVLRTHLGPPRLWPAAHREAVALVLSRLSAAGRRHVVDHAAKAFGLSPIGPHESWPERLRLLHAEAEAFDPDDGASSDEEADAPAAATQAVPGPSQLTEDAALARFLRDPSSCDLDLKTLPKTQAVALALLEARPVFGPAMVSHFDLAAPQHRPLTLRIAALQPEVLFHPPGPATATTAQGAAALAEDAEVAGIVLASAPHLLGRLAAPLRARRDLVAPALAADGLALRDVGPGLEDDAALVGAAVRQAGEALAFASPKMRADRPTVLAAVAQDGRALRFAAAPLRRDPEVVLCAVAQNGYAMAYAAPALRADPAFVAKAVACDGRALRFARDPARRDRALTLLALAQGAGLGDVPSRFVKDHQVVSKAVSRRGRDLAYASPALRDDDLIARQAVRQDPASLALTSERLRTSRDFVLEAVEGDARAFFGAAPALFRDRRTVAAFVAACRRQAPAACQEFSHRLADGRRAARLSVRLPGEPLATVDLDALEVVFLARLPR